MKNEGQSFRASQSIPIVVNGILYLPFPFNRVAAIESTTGNVIWEFTARSGFSGKLGSMRSLEYWPGDAQSPPEVLFGTEEGELYALNAKTGKPVPGFGREGVRYAMEELSQWKFTGLRLNPHSASAIWNASWKVRLEVSTNSEIRSCRR